MSLTDPTKILLTLEKNLEKNLIPKKYLARVGFVLHLLDHSFSKFPLPSICQLISPLLNCTNNSRKVGMEFLKKYYSLSERGQLVRNEIFKSLGVKSNSFLLKEIKKVFDTIDNVSGKENVQMNDMEMNDSNELVVEKVKTNDNIKGKGKVYGRESMIGNKNRATDIKSQQESNNKSISETKVERKKVFSEASPPVKRKNEAKLESVKITDQKIRDNDIVKEDTVSNKELELKNKKPLYKESQDEKDSLNNGSLSDWNLDK